MLAAAWLPLATSAISRTAAHATPRMAVVIFDIVTPPFLMP
jgi:hypothetical protein